MGYRKGAILCEMCCRELEATEELKTLGGLAACPACRDEVPRAAARAWNLSVGVDEHVHEKQSRYDSSYVRSTVAIGLPTELPISGGFRAENIVDRAGGALGAGDFAIDDATFDEKVWIEYLTGDLAGDLLAEASVRQALIDAVAAAGTVWLEARGIKLVTTKGSLTLEELDAIDRAGIVLGVAIERWVRGAPGAAPVREGCRDRPPDEHAAGGQWKRLSPEEAPPPADSVYYKKVKPGPPCPACGELMTNAVTEYFCKGCGHVVARPDVVKRMRRRSIKEGLILAALLVGLGLLIAFGVWMEGC